MLGVCALVWLWARYEITICYAAHLKYPVICNDSASWQNDRSEKTAPTTINLIQIWEWKYKIS